LAEIKHLRAVASEGDRVLQELVDDLREIFGVGLCMASLILPDAQYFRAWSGDLPPDLVEARQDRRDRGLCRHVVESERPLVVPDFSADARFGDQHFRSRYGFRSYAGAPIVTYSGQTVGSLCLLDRRAREFDGRDVALLKISAKAAAGRLEALGALEREREYRRNVFETANDAILIFDLEAGVILEANLRACEMYQLPSERLVGSDAASLSTDPERGRRHYRSVLADGSHRGFESVHRRADGTLLDVSVNSSVIEWQGRRAILNIVHDVTERRRLEERLNHLALHDPLTDLPNRRLFADRLRLAHARVVRSGEEMAVLFLDLDGFKAVNDRRGHEAGDRVLVAVADVLKRCVRPEDTVARLGGDEFTVLLEAAGEREAARVAARIEGAFQEPIRLGDHEVRMTVSVGMAVGPPLVAPADLLGEADQAMYREKARRGTAGHREAGDSGIADDPGRKLEGGG
jgi:diguanylate cyclase (GGDEF)-like protein/PAS domain S-box-containing protein